MTDNMKRYKPAEGEVVTVRLLDLCKDSRERLQEAAHARRVIFAGLGVSKELLQGGCSSTEGAKNPPTPTECSECSGTFDAYRKRFDMLCGDCVPKT